MNRLRAFGIVALVVGVVLCGSSVHAAGKAKPPKRTPPKPQHHTQKPAPKPKAAAKKPVHHAAAHKKPAPKVHPHVEHKVKPQGHHPAVHKSTGVAKSPKKPKEPVKVARHPRLEQIHRFAHWNERSGEYSFDSRWWYSYVVYPTTVSTAVAATANYETMVAPASTPVAPPVIMRGQGLPMAAAGAALADTLDGLDVENHWLAGKKVDWKTGNALEGEGEAPASNGGAFVAVVCARFKVPMPAPAPENFLPGTQHDWLLNEGAGKGWQLVGEVEAQLLANQGWVVIAAWKNTAPAGERTVAGLTAIVRPDGKQPAADIAKNGPRLIVAGAKNHRAIALKDVFPAKAWTDKEVVFLANRPR